MRNLNEDTLLGNCIFCKLKVYNNDGWRNIVSTVIEGKWICGECLANLWRPATEALKRYKAHVNENKTKEEKIANNYGISIDPKTGKLKKRKALNRESTLVDSKEV